MKRFTGCLVVLALLCGLSLGGFRFFMDFINRRYEALSRASEAALNHGDNRSAARLALAAMQGRNLPFLSFNNDAATARLRDALMVGQAPLAETSATQFPGFTITGDDVPTSASIGSDGKRLMIMHNEDRDKPIVDIYALPSGRLLNQFPQRDIGADGKIEGAVADFSPDLSTSIHFGPAKTRFRDTLTGKPILTDINAPDDFYGWTVSNDRRLVAARGDKSFRIWEFGVPPARVTDIPYGPEGYSEDYDIAPGGRMLLTGNLPETGPFKRTVIDLPSRRVKLSLSSKGPIDAVFSQDGRYLAASFVTDYTPERWTQATRVWDLTTGGRIGPVINMEFVTDAVTLFNGQILVILSQTQAQFLDLRTTRPLGPPIDLPHWSAAFTDTTAYVIGPSHILVRYNLNPLFAMPARSLAAEACRRWGAKGQMMATAQEVTAAQAWFRIDPCLSPGGLAH